MARPVLSDETVQRLEAVVEDESGMDASYFSFDEMLEVLLDSIEEEQRDGSEKESVRVKRGAGPSVNLSDDRRQF